VDKPKGPTSHDIVDFVRRHFNVRKVGHSGTLDPNATGLLILLLGNFTKLSSRLTDMKKDYEATLLLGITTDTQDIQGRIVKQNPVDGIGPDEIKNVFSSFKGKLSQLPPMVSAKRIRGRRFYELSRKGKTIERKPIEIKIFEIWVDRIRLPEVDFFVSCSKGTYVRTLCEDIGNILGCGGCLNDLRRLMIGNFKIEDAISFDGLRKLDREKLREYVITSIP
ncbi:MAG: tRNA pseudouridine(55) synthase TruB, partial [Candidatus Omnitrophica bacterium]|nr:tRNA pseudouridine(55) synthase TruB [Candidatus Omnitrophota bacterium]